MFASNNIPRNLQNAGLFLAFCLLLAWGEGVAQAGCGDYVLVNGHVLHEQTPAVPLPLGKIPPPKPCHGPGCSQQPIAPAAPPTVPSSIERLDGIAGSDFDSSRKDSASVGRPESMRWIVQAMLRDIFRPPCTATRYL